MTRFDLLTRFSAGLLVGAAIASTAASTTVLAQRTPTETVPGGVEARPSDSGTTAPRASPAPAPAAPMVGSPSPGSPVLERTQPPAIMPAAPPAKDPKDKKGKKASSKTEPAPLTRSLVPGDIPPATAAPATPANDESKPGAVERAPSAPKQPPQ